MIAFGLIIAFLLVYFLLYVRKIKNKREHSMNSVEQFHNNYLRQTPNPPSKQAHTRHYIRNSQPKQDAYTKYVTKYNSSEDYREK